ncbi:MAG: hypothetical protein ABF679_10395 [Lentilactobacillus diolivorans]|uniref:hypothetical protein n=1 Tax=Lentilactobacillus diolivorans TaxID=179838 RepID=UPI0039EA7893
MIIIKNAKKIILCYVGYLALIGNQTRNFELINEITLKAFLSPYESLGLRFSTLKHKTSNQVNPTFSSHILYFDSLPVLYLKQIYKTVSIIRINHSREGFKMSKSQLTIGIICLIGILASGILFFSGNTQFAYILVTLSIAALVIVNFIFALINRRK